jgi:predicted P-loop ATPase
VSLRLWLERKAFKPVGRELMRDTVLGVATRRRFDSGKLWLDALKWDGVPRIEKFLSTYFGARDRDYVRAVSLYWWTGHAGKVIEPGLECHAMPILVGDQGAGKSSALKAIVPSLDNFIEINLEHKDADLSRKMRGALLGEVAELRGLRGRGSESTKAWMTSPREQWTPKFMERARTMHRRLMIVGTTNEEEFLDDPSGERRYLPVRINDVDVEGIRRDREQLWAEAREQFKAAGLMWQEAARLGRLEHAAYKVTDAWERPVRRWISTPDAVPLAKGSAREHKGTEGEILASFGLEDVFIGALGKSAANCTLADQHRMGKVLRALGFQRARKRMNGELQWFWEGAVPLCSLGNGVQGNSEKGSEINGLA